jgi:hypothetical protein
MFAGPLLSLLVVERQWRRAAIYALGYTMIGAFWLWWPSWIWSLLLAGPDARPQAGVDYITRLAAIISDRDRMSLADTLTNLLRFVAWQHLLLLPLMLLGWRVARKDRFAEALALGVIVTALVMAVILPYQGYGFGYRYLHGLIGNCILLGVYGWKSLGARQAEWRQALIRTSVGSLLIILPLQLWMSHAFYAPAARADSRIAEIPADYAIIGRDDAPFSLDLVHNPPKLDHRPVRLLGEEVTAQVAALICRDRPSVALANDHMFDEINEYYGFPLRHTAAERNLVLAPRLEAAGCRVEMLQ